MFLIRISCYFILRILHDSCWIKSDDGAIAAFIVPIMTMMLVYF